MSSSQQAQLILAGLWLVATLTLTSAQLRVLDGDGPGIRRYLLAWFVCALLIGGVLGYVDRATGRVGTALQLANFALVGVVSAIALAAGYAMETRLRRMGRARFLRLVMLHGVIVALAYPFA